jgi:hypothetical protein
MIGRWTSRHDDDEEATGLQMQINVAVPISLQNTESSSDYRYSEFRSVTLRVCAASLSTLRLPCLPCMTRAGSPWR